MCAPRVNCAHTEGVVVVVHVGQHLRLTMAEYQSECCNLAIFCNCLCDQYDPL